MTNAMKRERRRERRKETRDFANSLFWLVEDEIVNGWNDKRNRPVVYDNFAGTPTLHLAALVKAGKRIGKLAAEAEAHLNRRYENQRKHKFYEQMGAFTFIDIPVRIVDATDTSWYDEYGENSWWNEGGQ